MKIPNEIGKEKPAQDSETEDQESEALFFDLSETEWKLIEMDIEDDALSVHSLTEYSLTVDKILSFCVER